MTLAMHYVSVQDCTLTVILKQQEHVRTYTIFSHVIAATMDVVLEGLLCLSIALSAQMIAEIPSAFTLINPVTLLKLLYRVFLSPIIS